MNETSKNWRTARREIDLHRVAVMAILNVTPDSFSDGGQIARVDEAVRRAEQCIAEGAGILDIGGESTRPGSSPVDAAEEIRRVVPAIEAIAKRFDVPISVDTTKSEVARAAIDAGAEIINDISALRFDKDLGQVAAETLAGLVLMHSRGEFRTMHSQPPVQDVFSEVREGLREAISNARNFGIRPDQIVLDVGIGFGKTPEQNLEIIARLDKLIADFVGYPMLVGTSKKSFIAKVLDGTPAGERLAGSLATAAIAVWNGAKLVRVHDVRETVDTVRIVESLKDRL